MPNMEGMVRIRLGVLHHHAFTFRSAGPKAGTLLQNGFNHAGRIFGSRKIQIQIGLGGLDPAQAGNRSDIRLGLLCHFGGALRHRESFPFSRFGFVGRQLEKGGRNPPFPAERDRRPFKFTQWDLVFGAKGLDFGFNRCLFLLEHGSPSGSEFEKL